MCVPPDLPTIAEAASQPRTLVIMPGEGKTLAAYGDTAQIKLSGEQTNGSMSVVVTATPPGGGPPPHRHHNEDEMFLVLEGSVRFLANGEWTEPLAPGSIVYTPRGAVHTFQNAGRTPCRQLIIITPSAFEQFFARSAEIFAEAGVGGTPDLARLLAISNEYRIEFVPPLGIPA